jgi:methionyl-tRNA formyltransferase
VAVAARALGLTVLQPGALDAEVTCRIRSLGPEVLVVAAYGRIFREAFLSLFPRGGVNLHPSLLPRHRGPSPIPAAILAGDRETGVTIQRIALKVDAGDILAQSVHPLRGDETSATLADELSNEGAELLAGVLRDMAEGRAGSGRPQDEQAATYCRTLRKEDGVVDWREPAAQIERRVRAFDPWPRVSTRLGGETLLLLKSHVYPGNLSAGEAPGDVGGPDRAHGLLVRTGSGILAVERLQLQARTPQDWRSFLNGHPEIVGSRLGAAPGP